MGDPTLNCPFCKKKHCTISGPCNANAITHHGKLSFYDALVHTVDIPWTLPQVVGLQ